MIKVLACNGSFFNHTIFVSSAALLSLPSQTIALIAIFAKQAKNKRKTQLLGFAQNKSKVQFFAVAETVGCALARRKARFRADEQANHARSPARLQPRRGFGQMTI